MRTARPSSTVTIHAQESGQSCGQTPRTRWDIEDRSVAEVRGPLPARGEVLTDGGGKPRRRHSIHRDLRKGEPMLIPNAVLAGTRSRMQFDPISLRNFM